MASDELDKYVHDATTSGKSIDEVVRDMVVMGWREGDARTVVNGSLRKQPEEEALVNPLRSKMPYLTVIAVLTITVLAFGAISMYLWHDRLDLADMNDTRVREFYTQIAESQVAFTDTGEMVFPDERKFIAKKTQYIERKENFVEADLRTMRLTLYAGGVASTTFPILTKGKEGSWWETPTGDYKVLGKTTTAYSSIGNVWMPYSIQFYGNYFIHGWPYHDDGTLVPKGYSGGCIRLATSDAKDVFSFVKTGTPILVLENQEEHLFGELTLRVSDAAPPSVGAKSFLIYNLGSGEVVLGKHTEDQTSIASLTKLMTAVVAHEIIYLGRPIRVRSDMLAGVATVFHPATGEQYTGLDLLYPLLMQSSNETADVLAGFLGEETFVHNMNAKASALNMGDTQFVDASGMSVENVSTANDLARLLQYVYYKRPFLFDISRGVVFDAVGSIAVGNTVPIDNLQNVNEFVGRPDLIGVKNGETSATDQTMISVWNVHTEKGNVPMAIIVLGSEDRKGDTEVLLQWVKDSYAGQ